MEVKRFNLSTSKSDPGVGTLSGRASGRGGGGNEVRVWRCYGSVRFDREVSRTLLPLQNDQGLYTVDLNHQHWSSQTTSYVLLHMH